MNFLALLNLGKLPGLILKNLPYIMIMTMILVILYQNISGHRFVVYIDTIPYWKNQSAQYEKSLNTALAELSNVTHALDVSTKTNKKLTDGIEISNKAVSRWKQQTADATADSKRLMHQINTTSIYYNNKANSTLKLTTPNDCNASIKFLRESVGDIKWGK